MRDKSFGNQGSGYPSGMSHSSVSPRPQHQEVPLRMHGEGLWVPNVHPIQLSTIPKLLEERQGVRFVWKEDVEKKEKRPKKAAPVLCTVDHVESLCGVCL